MKIMSKELEKTTENKITGYNPFNEITGEDVIYPIGNPRQWRANCSATGSFRKGEASLGELTLNLRVLFFVDYPQHNFFAGTYKTEDWILLFFVDDDNVLCQMYIKGSSRKNFKNEVINITAEKLPMATQIIKATMRPTQNEKGKFHVVDFSHSPNTDKVQMHSLAKFWDDHVTVDKNGNVIENLIYSELAVQQLAKHNEILALNK